MQAFQSESLRRRHVFRFAISNLRLNQVEAPLQIANPSIVAMAQLFVLLVFNIAYELLYFFLDLSCLISERTHILLRHRALNLQVAIRFTKEAFNGLL